MTAHTDTDAHTAGGGTAIAADDGHTGDPGTELVTFICTCVCVCVANDPNVSPLK
jgi:hypothetical protein